MENTTPDPVTKTYRQVRRRWHVVALRALVMGLPLIVYNIIEPLTRATESLLYFLLHNLPNPQFEEWVPFEQLSKKRQREIELMEGTLAARFW